MSLVVHADQFIPANEDLAGVATNVLLSRAKDEIDRAERHVSEAERCVFRAGNYLLAIRDGDRFKELGYGSFTAFLNAEFKGRKGKAWHELNGAIAAREVPNVPSGRAARELCKLGDGDKMRAADKIARELAGDKVPTAVQYREAVETVAPSLKPASRRTGEEELQYRRDIGDIPANAEAWVIYPDPVPDDAEPEEPERELTDDEWLETLEARPSLSDQCRAWFDADALAFRAYATHRIEAAKRLKPIGNAAKKSTHGHIGVWLSRAFRFFHHRGPTQWNACKDCKGTGQMPLIGDCADCRGNGYLI